ncbi:MAG: hypothetical protein CVV08_00860 [Gammaproteobacteria bacterium HGW-Gammaproteobacteria-12]|nr:MAG: hypothetical protein CVV08_00860 [Gammaproteobacteria bacterium HGW-Gammaproteobacteria-12]
MEQVSRGTLGLPLASHNSVEGSSHAESSQAAEVNHAQRREQNRREIQDHLHTLFDAYRKPTTLPPDASAQDHTDVTEHNQKIDELVAARAKVLAENDEDVASVRETMDKAKNLDKWTTSGSSLVAGIPFAAVAVAQHLKPGLVSAPAQMLASSPLARAAIESAVAGAQAGIADQASTSFQKEMNDDAFFLKVPSEKLHDVMVQALEKKEPNLARKAADGATTIQTFNMRNVVRNGVDIGMAAKRQGELSAQQLEKAVSQAASVKTSFTALGGLAAGIGTGHWNRSKEESQGLRGEALLFARKDAEPKDNLEDETDWLETYRAAKDANWKSMASNGMSRVGNATLGALSNTLEGARSVLTGGSVLTNGVALSGGFGLTGLAQKGLSDMVSNPVAKAAIDNATNLVGSGVTFTAYGASAATGQTLADKGREWLDKDNHAAPKAAGRQAIESAKNGANQALAATRNGANQALDSTAAGLRHVRDTTSAAIATGRQAFSTAATMVGGIDSDAITRQLMGQVNELRQRQRQQPNEEEGMEMT